MKLIISDPAYYSKIYGVEKEIRIFLDQITKYFADNSYSDLVDTIRISSPVVPNNLLNEGLWHNEHTVFPTYHDAIIFNHIDYASYVNASIGERKTLLSKNILICMKILEKKRN